jgi:hypothetical protein
MGLVGVGSVWRCVYIYITGRETLSLSHVNLSAEVIHQFAQHSKFRSVQFCAEFRRNPERINSAADLHFVAVLRSTVENFDGCSQHCHEINSAPIRHRHPMHVVYRHKVLSLQDGFWHSTLVSITSQLTQYLGIDSVSYNEVARTTLNFFRSSIAWLRRISSEEPVDIIQKSLHDRLPTALLLPLLLLSFTLAGGLDLSAVGRFPKIEGMRTGSSIKLPTPAGVVSFTQSIISCVFGYRTAMDIFAVAKVTIYGRNPSWPCLNIAAAEEQELTSKMIGRNSGE